METKVLDPWPYLPELCPADDEFIEWLERVGPGDCIFHMGTGAHHKVGIYCSERGIACMGITASRDEHAHGWQGYRGYQVLYGNLYELDTRLLPNISVMTLFHLGELVDLFGDIPNDTVINLMKKVRSSGLVIFYSRSSAWDRARETVSEAVNQGVITYYSSYEDLEIYRRVA